MRNNTEKLPRSAYDFVMTKPHQASYPSYLKTNQSNFHDVIEYYHYTY